MAIRIPTPDVQGAQRLGAAQAEAAGTPFQRLSLPDTAFNARMLQQIGQSGVQFADYLQEKEDERLLLELQAGIGNWERSLLYGQDVTGVSTGRPGLLSLEGRDAFGITERVASDFDSHLSEYNTSLQGLSRNGRAAAQKYAQSRRETLLNQAANFEFQQREAYNAKLRREAEAAAAAAAETAWASPESMAAAEARLISATTNRVAAEVAGIPDETERQRLIDEAVSAETEKFQRTAILRAIGQGKAEIGRRLYDEAVERGTITLQENDLLTRTVQFGEQIDVVVNGATMIYEQNPNDLNAAVAAARSMGLDGDTERDLVNEIERRFSAGAAIEAQQAEQLFERARQAALRGTLFDELDRTELARLPAGQRADLQALNGGFSPIGDAQRFYELSGMSAQDLASYDLSQDINKLSQAQYESLLTLKAKAAATVAGQGDYEWTGIRTEYSTVDAAITSMGVPSGSGAKEDDLKNRAALFVLMNNEKERRLAAGEPWDAAAIAQYADSLNVNVPVGGEVFGGYLGSNTQPLWKVITGVTTVEIDVPGVPPDAVQEIVVLLTQANDVVTPERVRAVYDAAVAGGN